MFLTKIKINTPSYLELWSASAMGSSPKGKHLLLSKGRKSHVFIFLLSQTSEVRVLKKLFFNFFPLNLTLFGKGFVVQGRK